MISPRITRPLRIRSVPAVNGTPALDAPATGTAVIDAVGRTQQVPIVEHGMPQPVTGVPADDSITPTIPHAAPASVAGPLGAPPTDSTPVQGIETPASALPVVAPPATPATPATSATPAHVERSNAAVLTTELVGGLRNASRHLSRPSASEGHLRTELTITARRIDALVRANDAHDQAWAIAAMSLVHDAGAALEQRRITDGWQLLRAAQTEMLDGLDHRSLSVERANITGTDLVVDDNIETGQLRSEVWAMRHTKNTYRAELERRLFEAARGLFHRAWMIIGVLVLGAIGVLVAAPSSDSTDALGSITSYLTIVGLGMTGAAVSHVLFTNSSKRASAISEVANPLHIVMLRLAFGGVAGLLVVVLLQADIQNLINVTALSAYPWALLGGFAERYVDRVIDQVEADAHTAAAEACRAGVS